MSRVVEIASGKTNVQLPDGKQQRNGGEVVVLTDDQFSLIPGKFFPGTVIDRGDARDLLGVQVQVAAGKSNVVLPNGETGVAGDVFWLTPAQFRLMPTTLFPATVINADDGLVFFDVPVNLHDDIAADGVVKTVTPTFAGTILTVDFVVTTPVTTGSKASTVGVNVLNSGTNGGVVSLTSSAATPAGKQISGSAIVAARNEVQTLTIASTTGGNFKITFGGQQTGVIANTAAAATVQAALEALSTIGTGNVVCAGGALNTAPVTITFQGTLANKDVALATITSSTLTDGGSHTETLTETTKGGTPTFASGDKVQLVASSTTRFVEGAGFFRIAAKRT